MPLGEATAQRMAANAVSDEQRVATFLATLALAKHTIDVKARPSGWRRG